MNRKLLFFDIDGTLSLPGNTIRPQTVAALKKAQENGHLIFISTGRRDGDLPKDIPGIGFDGFIYSAGAKVVVGDEVIVDKPLSKELQEKITQTLDGLDVFYTMEARDADYASSDSDPAFGLKEKDLEGLGSEALRNLERAKNDEGFPKALPRSLYNGQPVYKICYRMLNEAPKAEIHERLDESAQVVDFGNMFDGMPFVVGEISDHSVNKGTAVREICRMLGVDAEDTVAFGDSMNDAEMIEAAGMGVAMGNAEPELKEMADAVCESCYDDGVVRELTRLGII